MYRPMRRGKPNERTGCLRRKAATSPSSCARIGPGPRSSTDRGRCRQWKRPDHFRTRSRLSDIGYTAVIARGRNRPGRFAMSEEVPKSGDGQGRQRFVTDHLANERTYLAFLRTSVGLISFGITINRFSLFLLQTQIVAPGRILPF